MQVLLVPVVCQFVPSHLFISASPSVGINPSLQV
jgi:hypothetical protein